MLADFSFSQAQKGGSDSRAAFEMELLRGFLRQYMALRALVDPRIVGDGNNGFENKLSAR